MKILLVGGTGLIGTFLKNKLTEEGYSVPILSRRKSGDSQTFLWNNNEAYIDLNAFKGVSGIINLTGANITGAIFEEANLSGAIWIDGRTCALGSVGTCN